MTGTSVSSTQIAPPETPPPTAKAPLRARARRYRWLYLLLLPGVLYFLIFRYLPMFGLVIAFQDYLPFLGISGSPWVGFQHFEELFSSPDFPRIMGNTLFLAALNILIVFPAPIIVALMLNELRVQVVKRSIQSLIYIPHFLSWTIVASLTYLLFALDIGAVTSFVNDLTGGNVAFLTDPDWFRPLIILQSLWKATGWGTIIYLAALTSVDPNLYEAAKLDGANRWQQMWHVTLPAIASTVVVMAILSMGNFLDTGFEQIYLMINSLNRPVAEVFDTYVYSLGIEQGSFSYSTAVGMFKAVIGVALVFGSNWIARRFGQRGLF
ncbi:binding-protein-dependent transport systems inner membrane component [Streptomyces bingchenggensis BCW-1]|uniref:Binding-protein-dependent transport systems inner membrane component n=1 Tax=Streptomyces bingchenggensis (strain BCW-1) TaxID=749414 RepID=D7BW38_STRBB|nr:MULTISPECIES: ABC transporter permease subunit [Streptomyces]ADI11748.1 binding-protein-dependent transport systems inner membrane component [Streptomyces bingchenggensis BCW-1]